MNGACRSALQYAENETVIFSDTGAPGAVTNMFFGGQFGLPGAKTGGVGYRESVRACDRRADCAVTDVTAAAKPRLT